MQVRDAVESDAPALATFVELPPEVMRNVVHDRAVRVAVADGAASPDDGVDPEEVRGFVSFDVREGAVHVTQFGGDVDSMARLLSEPVRFAEREGMAVELLVDEGRNDAREAAERAGFEPDGPGPTFEGEPTVRYRHD